MKLKMYQSTPLQKENSVRFWKGAMPPAAYQKNITLIPRSFSIPVPSCPVDSSYCPAHFFTLVDALGDSRPICVTDIGGL